MPRSEYSQAERVGEQIVRLIAMFAMHLMSAERERLKLFSFDEGWRLLGDPAGRALLASLQRMGRSELAVPIISTQLVTDTLIGERESLENLRRRDVRVRDALGGGGRARADAARARPRGPEDAPEPARAGGGALPVSRSPRAGRGDPGRRRRAVAAAGLLDDPCAGVRGCAWGHARSAQAARCAQRGAAIACADSTCEPASTGHGAASAAPTRRRSPAPRRASGGEQGAERVLRSASGGNRRADGRRRSRPPAMPQRRQTRWSATGWAARCAGPVRLRSCSVQDQREQLPDLRVRGGAGAHRQLRVRRAHRHRRYEARTNDAGSDVPEPAPAGCGRCSSRPCTASS